MAKYWTLSGILFATLFVNTHPALAVNISFSLPGVSATANPVEMIKAFYLYAISISGLLAFGMIVYGGVKYTLSAGNPGLQGDAKDMISQALIGLMLLLGVYLILSVINPGLTTLSLPSLDVLPDLAPTTGAGAGCSMSCDPGYQCRLDADNNPTCQIANNINVGGTPGSCQHPSASVLQDIQGTCFDSDPAVRQEAASVFTLESRGNRFVESGTDHCTGNSSNVSFSVGFAQVNYLANGSLIGGACSNIRNYFTFQNADRSHPQGNCVDRNSRGICMHWNCQLNTGIPGAQQALAACKQQAIDQNMSVACKLYQDRIRRGQSGFADWATSRNRCGYAR
jgi:hypothetical protein